jgi:hypothetical protein
MRFRECASYSLPGMTSLNLTLIEGLSEVTERIFTAVSPPIAMRIALGPGVHPRAIERLAANVDAFLNVHMQSQDHRLCRSVGCRNHYSFILPAGVTGKGISGFNLSRLPWGIPVFGKNGSRTSAGGQHALYLYRLTPGIGKFVFRQDCPVLGCSSESLFSLVPSQLGKRRACAQAEYKRQ